MSTVLVTGATGNTGVPILSGLVERDDVTVRAMVRHATGNDLRKGVQPVVADFDTPETIRRALEGVDAAYLVTPSSARAEAQQLSFVEMAAEAEVSHLVVLSQLGSREDSPVRFLRYHAAVERRVDELDLCHTFLRPNLFFQGLYAMAGLITATGRFVAPIGDARVSAIDVRDIADVAVAALLDEVAPNQTLTLTGPRAVTHAEMAQALGEGLGRDIGFDDIDPHAFAVLLEGILPPWQIEGTLEDYAHYSRGEAAAITTTVQEITGHPARDVRQFAHDCADRFRAAVPAESA
jgi:uncharacterized protein YbjT (DUF2867 family)